MLSGKQEAMMSDRWVRCTDLKGKPSFINLSEALAMHRQMTGGEELTIVLFRGSNLEVKETPDQILGLKAL